MARRKRRPYELGNSLLTGYATASLDDVSCVGMMNLLESSLLAMVAADLRAAIFR
ncbi:MAG: hypothetical protein ACI92G_003997, partial [Candidatus Pelagisphaera sp.]